MLGILKAGEKGTDEDEMVGMASPYLSSMSLIKLPAIDSREAWHAATTWVKRNGHD